MRFARWVFAVAGVYGLLVITPLYFMEGAIGWQNQPEFYYGFVGLALVWQILFLFLARDPLRLRPIMIPAILEKLVYGIALIVLYCLGRIELASVLVASPDWLFAILFLTAYLRLKPKVS